MITFKQFLLEGGHATAKFNTERANAQDIKAALEFVSKTLDMPYETLKNDLLGSTALTLLGKKKDSGDLDIAFSLQHSDVNIIDKKMRAAVNDEGGYNAGTKVGSYAVPVNGKKVQVDLMFVNNKDWAKFIYHSEAGAGSKYPGAIRNIIMMTALTFAQEPGKDFTLDDSDGRQIARARKSIKMDQGMERLFKLAKFNEKTGKYNKSMDSVDPKELAIHLKSKGHNLSFSQERDHTDDPKKVVEFIFGKGTDPKSVSSAEGVIAAIKKMKNSKEILAKAKSELERLNMEIPTEL